MTRPFPRSFLVAALRPLRLPHDPFPSLLVKTRSDRASGALFTGQYSGPIGRLSQFAANGALSLLAMITFLGEHRVITDPVAAMLNAGQTTGHRCSVRHQPVDDDLPDHAQHVTRRDLVLANCAI